VVKVCAGNAIAVVAHSTNNALPIRFIDASSLELYTRRGNPATRFSEYGTACLLGAQCVHGIDGCGTARGDVAGQKRRDGQHGAYPHHRFRVGRVNAEE
jgi:hypothetical protein